MLFIIINMQVLFSNLQHSEFQSLPPDAVRTALAAAHQAGCTTHVILIGAGNAEISTA